MEENFYELLSLGLAVAVGIAGVIAFIYRKGQAHGIDTACGKRIEDKIDNIDKKINTTIKEGDDIHDDLREGLHAIDSKVDKLTGSFETFRHLVNKT